MEQTCFVSYHNLLVFVGSDGYTPQEGRFCNGYYPKMNAKNLILAKQECSTNTNCAKFTDFCGDGDYFIWCRAEDVTTYSVCDSVVYVKNN